MNSVLQEEDRGGRARRLTVFDNGTLLVSAVGMEEEGEYTCYAENQGGLDTMKVLKGIWNCVFLFGSLKPPCLFFHTCSRMQGKLSYMLI